jgi:hypothetical protein
MVLWRRRALQLLSLDRPMPHFNGEYRRRAIDHIVSWTDPVTRTSDDLWSEAVQSLNTVDKAFIDFQRSDRRAVLEDVLQAAEIKRLQCLRQRWKIKKKNGEVIILRDVFEKIIKWINTVKTIGDIVIQYDPGHAALPWAGLSLLMQVSHSS